MSDVIYLLVGMGLGLLMRLIIAIIDVYIKDAEK
jgi:hypothetical protein